MSDKMNRRTLFAALGGLAAAMGLGGRHAIAAPQIETRKPGPKPKRRDTNLIAPALVHHTDAVKYGHRNAQNAAMAEARAVMEGMLAEQTPGSWEKKWTKWYDARPGGVDGRVRWLRCRRIN